MLVPDSILPTFTIVHVAISLVAIISGFVVLFGMISDKRLDRWTASFLATTVATSVTGFGFPINADNRGRVTCLFRTQFPPQSGRISPVFSAFEARDLSAI
jgi:hypothetical protein